MITFSNICKFCYYIFLYTYTFLYLQSELNIRLQDTYIIPICFFLCRVSQPSIMFSYKPQVDDAMEEDTVSLPHQQSFSSLKTDSDYIYQVHVPSFHMPLDESQIAKVSSTAKKTSSLYSLTPRKSPRAPNTSYYNSQVTFYGTSPGSESSSKRITEQKSTLDLEKYTLTGSQTLGCKEKNLESPGWKTRSVSLVRHSESGLSSILSLSSHTHFTNRLRASESATHFLSESSKSSLETELSPSRP